MRSWVLALLYSSLLFLVALLASCGTSKKITTKMTTDSVSVRKTDSVSISTSERKEEKIEDNEIEVTLDTGGISNIVIIKTDSGYAITSGQKIKAVKVKERKEQKRGEVKQDFKAVSKTDSTIVKKTIKSGIKSTCRLSFWWLLLIPIYIVIRTQWKRIRTLFNL